jgi:hypothetical protein
MRKTVGQPALSLCCRVTACFALVLSACRSTGAQPSSGNEQRSAPLQAKVEHLSDEPAPIAVSAEPSAAEGAPAPTAPAVPPAPPVMADRALLKAAGAPRAASLTQSEAHNFIRLKASIERANAAHKKRLRSP